jgi:hypothetical protein
MPIASVVRGKPRKKRKRNDYGNLVTTERRKYP